MILPSAAYAWLAAVEAALQDADAQLVTDLGGRQEVTSARLWHGQVLVDWEPDPQAGDCLLRPALLQRLLDSGASLTATDKQVVLHAPGRIVSALGDQHAALVRRLGGARRVSLSITLRFADAAYIGGEESYALVDRGRPIPLLRLSADIRLRTPRTASPHTSPLPT
jgi:hypothetical protein